MVAETDLPIFLGDVFEDGFDGGGGGRPHLGVAVCALMPGSDIETPSVLHPLLSQAVLTNQHSTFSN